MTRHWLLVDCESGRILDRGMLSALRRQLPLFRWWRERLGMRADLRIELESPVESARNAGAL